MIELLILIGCGYILPAVICMTSIIITHPNPKELPEDERDGLFFATFVPIFNLIVASVIAILCISHLLAYPFRTKN